MSEIITSNSTSAPAAALQIHERAADAGAFAFVTELWYVDESIDAVHVRAIREVEPRFVPLKCRRIFKTPAGTEVSVDYFVIGKYLPQVQDGFEDAYIRLQYVPRGYPFPADKIQPLRTLQGEWEPGSAEYDQCAPPPPVPFGPWLIDQMRSIRKFFDGCIRIEGDEVAQGDFNKDKLKAILRAEKRRDEELMAQASAEARYRCRHEWRFLKKAIEEERWSDAPKQTQPFVDLGA